ncbi:MAG: protein translocase subunit SecD [Planctomycetota bacterium]|jgi:SecD/SecF fusion protein
MNKNLLPKFVLIIVLVVVATWTLYPPSKTLKPGIDLAGGTRLIYEIDAQGLEEHKKKDLAQNTIKVLRMRIDPANIQNLIWRPQGNTRFEIQMPLASAETIDKRKNYQEKLRELLDENINPAIIMRSLQKPAEERTEDFNDFTQGDPNRLSILNNLATAYDERKHLQGERDKLYSKLKTPESIITIAGLNLDNIKLRLGDWIKLDEQQLEKSIKDSLGGSEGNLDLLTRYVKMYAEWAEVVEQLTEPETGKNEQYQKAKKDLNKLNLTEDQINFCLEKPLKSADRRREIERLKIEFADRADIIDKIVAAYDEYQPFKGRLDDPRDLQRMLKGAGILEFRVLPTLGHPEVNSDEMTGYVESLREKGPKYASDNKYLWCELENIREWMGVNEQGRPVVMVLDGQDNPSVIAPFGNKYYVLASNKRDETILHIAGEEDWSLKAYPSTDRMGRRAIGFELDERGGRVFFPVTDKNFDRPLCVLLDGIAISAPTIQARIRKDGIIMGNFNQTKVEDMVNKLNAGSLSARLIEQPISTKTIGPTIGADNRDKGIKAGLIGLCLVMLCMLIYYMRAGSIADVALLMNILFVLAIMAGVRATFTLPGIAGIILTIGMSVDANVLIFERIREEQQKGSSLRIAVKNGYQRAFRTILDANLTTFITAAILLWRASEEVKGFAIVLMLGIGSSMFTALFVTRVIFDFLLGRRIIKDHLLMLRLIRKPNINWMVSRPIFLCISTLLIAAGLFVFFTRNDKYDIEFTGGTSAQVNLKESRTRQYVEDKIREIANDPNSPNPALAAANVYSIGNSGKQYEVNTTETNKTTVTITFPEAGGHTAETVISAIQKAQGEFGGELSNLRATEDTKSPVSFVITTSQVNKSLVKNVLTTAFADANISEPQVDEVVTKAIQIAFADELEIQQDLQPEIATEGKITEELIDSYPELADFIGGIKITCNIEKAATSEEINTRLVDLRLKPDMQNLNWSYSYKILSSDLNEMDPNQPVNSFAYISAEPEAGFRELSEDEWTRFVENETTKVLAATQLEGSLPQVRQFDPSVGAEAKTQALIAIILSLFAIVTYIWIRFGNVRYGIAAIVALVHDVCITLGAITACTYIATTPIGERLLIGDFKINLAIIAALLTIIGYSLNDTIVVFDRIRENRRKTLLNPQIINNSINQTLSRTLLTSFTTFIVVLIMYIFGGPGLRGFTFAIGFGIIIGTYSSIAIAAPVLLLGAGVSSAKKSIGGRTKTKNEKSK